MRIEQRDRAFLDALSRYGILSTEQIWTRFFPGVAKTTMLRRLRILEDEELIRRVRGLPNAQAAWVATKSGYSAIGSIGDPPKFGNQNTIRHEVRLSRVRMLLESFGLAGAFTPEWELKRRLATNNIRAVGEKQIPDGLFTAVSRGEVKTVALELELTAKGWGRYRKVVTEYEQKTKLSYVWYLIEEARIAKMIMPLWEKRHRSYGGPELLLATLTDLERDRENVIVRRSEHADCRLSELFDLKLLDHAGTHSVSTQDANLLSKSDHEKSA